MACFIMWKENLVKPTSCSIMIERIFSKTNGSLMLRTVLNQTSLEGSFVGSYTHIEIVIHVLVVNFFDLLVIAPSHEPPQVHCYGRRQRFRRCLTGMHCMCVHVYV